MIVFLISLFCLSFVVMAVMIGFKMAEIQTGRKYLFFNSQSDEAVLRAYRNTRNFLKRWNWRTLTLFYHFILEKVEDFFLNIYRRIRNKLTKPVKLVKGEGKLPEDTKGSSFYLKNIQEHKENNRPESEDSK